MYSYHTIVAVISCLALLASGAPSMDVEAAQKTKCYKGPLLLIAHGTGEKGEGALGYVSSGFKTQVPEAGSRWFYYPATMDNYTHSESTGVHRLKQHIREYVNHCGPRSKIILLGYSQGANVVTDVISGGTFPVYQMGSYRYSVPLIEKFNRHIVGVLLVGDPAFTANLRWDAGTSKKNGLLPRNPKQVKHLRRYANMMKSYCDKNDPYCAGGKKTDAHLKIHGEYFQKYTNEMVAWLVRKWYLAH